MGRIALRLAAWVLLGEELDRARADEIAQHQRAVVGWVGVRLGQLTGFLPVALGAAGREMKQHRAALDAYADEVIARAQASRTRRRRRARRVARGPARRARRSRPTSSAATCSASSSRATRPPRPRWRGRVVHGAAEPRRVGRRCAREPEAAHDRRSSPSRCASTPRCGASPARRTEPGVTLTAGGVTTRVRRGQLANVYLRGINRDPNTWTDPLRFDPSRHARPERQGTRQRALLPFGLGPRGCIGQHLALAEINAVLPALARRGDVVVDGPIVEDAGFALRDPGRPPGPVHRAAARLNGRTARRRRGRRRGARASARSRRRASDGSRADPAQVADEHHRDVGDERDAAASNSDRDPAPVNAATSAAAPDDEERPADPRQRPPGAHAAPPRAARSPRSSDPRGDHGRCSGRSTIATGFAHAAPVLTDSAGRSPRSRSSMRTRTLGHQRDPLQAHRGRGSANPPPEQVAAVDEDRARTRAAPPAARRAWRSVNAYGSLGRRTRSGARAATSRERDLGIPLVGVGEDVRDSDVREQRRAVGVGRERHPRSAPDRDERATPRPATRVRAEPRVPLVERRDGGSTPTAAASAHTAGPTSATERGDIECSASPRAASASRVLDAVLLVVHDTRSGASATTASTSTFFVPPTVGTPSRSQKRVHPTGATPSATSVSVALGTSETTLHRRHMRSSSCAFFVSNSAARDHTPVAQVGELVQLLRDTSAAAGARRRGRRRRRRPRMRPARALLRVRLHLAVELLLHAVGMPHVVEVRLAVRAGRLDVEVARADEPLEDALVEVDVVDALHRDLDAALGEHAGAVDDPVVGDDEVREVPLEVLERRASTAHTTATIAHSDEQPLHASPCVFGSDQDQDDEQRDPGEDVLGEEPPVRAEIERDLLAVVQQLLGVRHAEILRAAARSRTVRAGRRPSSSGGMSSPSSGSRSTAMRKPRARSAYGNRSTSASCAGPWLGTTRCASSWTST